MGIEIRMYGGKVYGASINIYGSDLSIQFTARKQQQNLNAAFFLFSKYLLQSILVRLYICLYKCFFVYCWLHTDCVVFIFKYLTTKNVFIGQKQKFWSKKLFLFIKIFFISSLLFYFKYLQNKISFLLVVFIRSTN